MPPPVIFGGPISLARRLLRGQMIGEIVRHPTRCSGLSPTTPWAGPPITPPALTDHTVAHLSSCPTHPTGLAPGDMWTAPLQGDQFLACLPQFSDQPPLQVDFVSFPSLPPLPSFSLLALSPFAATAGPVNLSSLPPFSFSPHPWTKVRPPLSYPTKTTTMGMHYNYQNCPSPS